MVKITNFNDNVVMVRLRVFSPISVDACYVVPTSRKLQIDVTDIVRLAEQEFGQKVSTFNEIAKI